ncbi:MAG: metallophosphoesterase [Thermoplasmata archaeon]|nr:MAG: metallophosphoesterase [Thermoplasmata archaeon]
MKLEPIPNEPALLLKGKKNTLIVADLHIGIEAELRESGINIPSQTEKMALHLIELCKEHEIHDLVIVGDVKHNVPMTSGQEYFEIPRIFERLKEHVEKAHITMGNHDGNLKNYLPDWVKIHGTKGFTYKGIGIFHGHTWPKKEVMQCSQVVIAHQHPTILFVETLGERDTRQCWVKADFITKVTEERYPKSNPKLIIMPTFNDLLGGIAVNERDSELLGPIMKNKLVDLDNAEIYLLDGTFLGKLSDLRV